MSNLDPIPEVEAYFKKHGPIAAELDAVQSPRVVVWFSCGAASAVAAKLAVEKYGSACQVVYCDTSRSEHPDNGRFLKDVERWLGVSITIIAHKRYQTVEQVFERERYMSGPRGAKCTVEMKKRPRFDFQRADDRHVFGYTVEEKRRVKLFVKNNPELTCEWMLIDAGITKDETLRRITAAGIELPVMYRLGYKHNNCLGCVKSQSPAYWNQVRRDFPDVFARRAEQSRALGVKLVKVKGKRVFLDTLDPTCAEVVKESLSCGPHCAPTKAA